jgi:hypothetical protein
MEYPWNFKSENVDKIVVDGILTNEFKAQCIKLSKVNSGINMPLETVSGATISVSDSTNTYIFSESSTERGSYYSNPFQAVVNKTYYLTINYQSAQFKATATMVPLTGTDSFLIMKEKNLNKYVQLERGGASMIEVTYNWASNNDYTAIYGSSLAKQWFYILNNVDINEVIGSDKEIIYFPEGTLITRRRYSLTGQHQTFIRSLLMETEWRGGVFDVQQGNVITNISNGALGFFGACTVVEDTVSLE